ncbi:expressed unknown protein [Seminavis robusta]|uniref:Uncharacterized protein n=1 Tax=Seminavis robusta TaxID=568900 RepID=A0A9N8H2K6_9STRA|nr:expressed unknown protein [Seminavis robusta]|eukprot:Sro67_g037650.1 n/a (214) ;mRNA; r:92327-92968
MGFQQLSTLLIVLLLQLGQALSFGFMECRSVPVSQSTVEHSSHPHDASLFQDRRAFLQASATLLVAISAGQPQPVSASNGEMANLELPSYIEFLMEKNAMADPDAFLYKRPDPKTQLTRLLDATKRLEDIPALAADKKWSQVQGILTGPLGTLAQTLNMIAKESSPEVQVKAKKVKETIFNISMAASKKSEAEVVAKTKAAKADLEAFVRAAF